MFRSICLLTILTFGLASASDLLDHDHGFKNCSADGVIVTNFTRGNIILPDSVNQSCVWTLDFNVSTVESFLLLESMVLGPGDSFTVSYIDSKNVTVTILNLTETVYNNLFFSGTKRDLIFNLTTSADAAARKFKLLLEAQSNQFSPIAVTDETIIKFLPTASAPENPSVNWSFSILPGSSQDRIVASVEQVTPGIRLTLDNKPYDQSMSDLFGSPEIKFSVNITTISDTSNALEMAIYTATAACSQLVTLNEKSPRTIVKVESAKLTNLVDLRCLWIIQSDNASSSLNILYDSEDLSMSDGNHFVIRRGNRKSAPVHVDITSQNYNMVKSNIYNSIVNSTSLFITFEAFKVKGENPHFDVKRLTENNCVSGSKTFDPQTEKSPTTFLFKSDGPTALFEASPNTSQPLTGDLDVYDQPILSSENLIASFRKGDSLPDQIWSNSGLLILNFALNQNGLTIKFTSPPTSRLGSTAPQSTGSIALMTNHIPAGGLYSWVIPPRHFDLNQDPKIVKSLVIPNLALETGSTLTLRTLNKDGHQLTINGNDVTSLPIFYLDANLTHILTYTRAKEVDNQSKTLLQASVNAVSYDACAAIEVTGEQAFKSYNYPHHYPLQEWDMNTQCRNINASASSIYITFHDVDLKGDHRLEFADSSGSFNLTANKIPGDVIVSNKVVINFSRPFNPDKETQRNIADQLSGRGFNTTLQPLECGGLITIKNKTGQVNFNSTEKPQKCLWIIQYDNPGSTLQVFNFSLVTPPPGIIIIDSNTMKDTNRLVNLTAPGFFNSTTETMIISYSSVTAPFQLNYSIMDCEDKCSTVHRCVNPSQKCNEINDCGDWSDEFHCDGKIPPPPSPTIVYNGVSGAVVTFVFIPMGIILGVLATIFGPRLWSRIRDQRYQEFREYSDVS